MEKFKLKSLIQNTLILLLVLFGNAFAGDKITFYHYDLQGSPVATTNEKGEVTWREEYSPYGEKLLKQDAGQDNVRGYTGHVFDEETGLTYMQARYYDPQIGRFMGVDPVGFDSKNPVSFNRYAYGNNNPYKFTDPNGENPLSALRGGMLAGEALNLAAYHTFGTTVSTLLANTAWDLMHNENIDSEENDVTIDDHIKGSLGPRGWTEEEIKDLAKTDPSGKSRDDRKGKNTSDGKKRNDSASVYGTRDGHIVVNDNTNEVVQISDKNDPNWVTDDRIEWNDEKQDVDLDTEVTD